MEHLTSEQIDHIQTNAIGGMATIGASFLFPVIRRKIAKATNNDKPIGQIVEVTLDTIQAFVNILTNDDRKDFAEIRDYLIANGDEIAQKIQAAVKELKQKD